MQVPVGDAARLPNGTQTALNPLYDTVAATTRLWHDRSGHTGMQRVSELHRHVNDIPKVSSTQSSLCSHCQLSKAQKHPFKSHMERTDSVCQTGNGCRIHLADVVDVRIENVSAASTFFGIVDAAPTFSGCPDVHFLTKFLSKKVDAAVHCSGCCIH